MAHRNGVGPRHRIDAEAREGCVWNPHFFPCSRTTNPKQYAVTDGRVTIGAIALIDGRHVATDATGQTLGTFATLEAPMASFGRPQ